MHHTHAPTERSPQAVRRWAAPLLAAATEAGPVPLAGTSNWSGLADDDPRKWAAVVTSALAWLSEANSAAIARRLRAELDDLDRAAADRFKAAACELSRAHTWSAVGPAHAELARRRAAPPLRPLPPFDPVAAARWVATGYSTTSCPGSAAA